MLSPADGGGRGLGDPCATAPAPNEDGEAVAGESEVHPGRGRQVLAATIVAWSAVVAIVIAFVWVGTMSGPLGPHADDGVDVFWHQLVWLSSWLGFPAVGAAIVTRRPRSALAWMLLGIGTSVIAGVSMTTLVAYQARVLGVTPHPVAVWLAAWTFVPGFTLAPFAIDRFPGDRAPTGRWRMFLRVAALVAVAGVLVHMVRPHVVDGDVEPDLVLDNPAYVTSLGAVPDTLAGILGFSMVLVLLAVIVRAVVSYRRSRGLERAQRKWFVASLCVFPLGFSMVFGLSGVLPLSVVDAIVAVTFFLTLNGLAAAILIAVTRYRLFEIDRLVSRSVSYLLVTLILAVVYAGGVLGIGALVPAGSGDLVIAASTLAVAALFQPLRRRVQALVDRRFNRARYDAARTVASFGSLLRDEVDLDALQRDLGGVVAQTLQPSRVSVWVRPIPEVGG